jgi:hypothetical protein
MREAARLNESLSEFERTILPGYERWEQENLSPLLHEEKRLDQEIHRLEMMIHSVHLESLWSGRTQRSVYKDIVREQQMQERSRQREQEAHSRARDHAEGDFDAQENHSHTGDPGFDEDSDLPDNERAFRSYARFACGIDPDDLSEREYRRMFGEFSRWREGRAGGASSKPPAGRTMKETLVRVKELYRVLVRRLHPDSGGSHADANRARLWHDLQDAYAAQDVERMEVLLAMTDFHQGKDAMHTSLYHLRKVAREMARTVRELQKRLREARESKAWIFWNAKDRAKAGAQLRSQVESRIRDAKKHLAILEREVSAWQAEAKPRKKVPHHAPGQNHFTF